MSGCSAVYLDGSFVTSEVRPGDFDACWDAQAVSGSLLDWELSTAEGFKDNRAARKKKYRGELFPANVGADGLGTPFREFFQHDKDGNPKGAVVIILMDLPLADLTDGLIKARIARGLTQKELAEKLNIDERQIQRYESTRYQGAALRRLQEVADALNVKIREEITLER